MGMGERLAPGRARASYSCEECGHVAARWMGRCPGCGAWGGLSAVSTARPGLAEVPAPVRLADLGADAPDRILTGIGELDRVLGGGLVAGSVVLIGGEPGIGKSTLVLEALAALSRRGQVLLVTGEESPAQVGSRAERLGADCGAVEVLAETRVDAVAAAIRGHRPLVCAVDSVQTLIADGVDGGPGSVGSVRQATAELVRAAKETGVVIILVGQVTKDGSLAGPRLLEHLVDCVLTLDGDELRDHRVLRAAKNRFGSTNETGVFRMGARGLEEVRDPTALFVESGPRRVGSCIFPAIEGSRAILVEVQALVTSTQIVPPRRVAVGIDRTRLAQIIAVLARHAGIGLGDQDVFVSVAAGARALDPAADLAIALAIVSAHRGRPMSAASAAFGELGLTGAVRPAGHAVRRLTAAAAGGVSAAVTPAVSGAEGEVPRPDSVFRVAEVREALQAAFD